MTYGFPGKVRDGKFHLSGFTPARLNRPPTDGYFLGASKGEETIGVSSIKRYAAGDPLIGTSYELAFCGDRPTVVFAVQPGQIVYITDIYFHAGRDQHDSRRWKGFRWAFRSEVDAARAWVEKCRPPDLARFVVADVSEMKTSGKC